MTGLFLFNETYLSLDKNSLPTIIEKARTNESMEETIEIIKRKRINLLTLTSITKGWVGYIFPVTCKEETERFSKLKRIQK